MIAVMLDIMLDVRMIVFTVVMMLVIMAVQQNDSYWIIKKHFDNVKTDRPLTFKKYRF